MRKKPAHQLVAEKRQWQHQPTDEEQAQGFKGWYSRGYLPHFDLPGLRQFITYRLDDALPAARRHEWQALLELEDEAAKVRQIEAYLDKGYGECHLRDPRIAAGVQENLLHFDGESYRLLAWAIMPNHVHALIEMLQTPLADVLQSWKSFTSKKANHILGRTGTFWQAEYFDRYIRDEEHLRKVIRYIENNPVNARLVRAPEEWLWGSAKHRSEAVAASARSAGGPPAGSNKSPKPSEPTSNLKTKT